MNVTKSGCRMCVLYSLCLKLLALSIVILHSCRHSATGFCIDRNDFAMSMLQAPCMFQVVILLVPPWTFPGWVVLILVLKPWVLKASSCLCSEAPPSLGDWKMSIWVRLYCSSMHCCMMKILLLWYSFSLLRLVLRQVGVQYCRSQESCSEGPVYSHSVL